MSAFEQFKQTVMEEFAGRIDESKIMFAVTVDGDKVDVKSKDKDFKVDVKDVENEKEVIDTVVKFLEKQGYKNVNGHPNTSEKGGVVGVIHVEK
jgi:hypothetical protein